MILRVAVALAAAIPTTTIYDGMPPERFQGNRTVTIRLFDNLNDPNVCGIPPQGKTFLGCVRENGRAIYMTNPCPLGDSQRYAEILCHELAHENGWPDTHGP